MCEVTGGSALAAEARLAEQVALAEIDRLIQELEKNRLGLDLLDDEIDPVSIE